MSKRGRRRSSRRRKSSSSSKQSSSAFLFQNQSRSTTVSDKKDLAGKHEENSLQKENVLIGFEDHQHDHTPPSQKRCKQDFNMAAFQEQRSVYTKTTELEEQGVKIVTSVSKNDMEKSQTVKIQQSHESLNDDPTNSSTPVTNIFNVSCTGSHVKVEIQEVRQGNPYGIKTTCVFMNENKASEVIINQEYEGMQIPDHQPLEQLPKHVTSHNQDINYRFTFGSINEQTKEQSESRSVCSSNVRGDPSYCRCCSDYIQQNLAKHLLGPPSLLDDNIQGKKQDALNRDGFFHISTQRVFDDIKCSSTLEDLTNDLASFRIGASAELASPFSSLEKEREDMTRSFDQLSESDNYEPMSIRPSVSTNRSSFVKDFIYCQKRKSWIRNNSIATVERKECLLMRKRRQTFPGTSFDQELIHEDVLLPYQESVSSFVMCSLPFQTERLEKSKQLDDIFSTYVRKKFSSQSRESSKTCSDSSETTGELTGMEPDREMSPKLYVEEIIQGGLAIQVIPPSCSGSEEQILQTIPKVFAKDKDDRSSTQSNSDSTLSECSVMTAHVDAVQHNVLSRSTSEEPYMDSLKKHNVAMEIESNPTEKSVSSLPLLLVTDELNDKEAAKKRHSEDTNKAADGLLCVVKPSIDVVLHAKELPVKVGKAEKPAVYRSNSEAREHLKPGSHKDRDGTDHWARKRKLFKESKQWSSAGGSSITSDITEESVSEDTLSTNVTVQDNEDRGFYTETFHSSAWIYQGDNINSGAIGPNLTVRTRAVSIRERTVRISKGAGEYPWGFRIQFSKPIVVTEVDTNGAAEEAGLIVGDYVLAVNGIDVTSIPHSEAANLARQGPDILTLTIGSDIARGPNTPRPPCRGYLHKRTQSGLIKGWRKRWFVLTHDCCLYYFKNKRDEGKRQPLSSVKLEGAEVGPDDSLGKPFVFKCRPQFGSRVYSLCATSNQEMKRWCEAMERAVHPITQNHVWVDVTRHNSNVPPLAVKNPDCLGLLNKLDRSKDTWVQHYCILKDACLYLYSGIRSTHSHGGIYLQGYVVREQANGSKKSTIELKPLSDEFKTFYFCADNSAENKRWILAIKASIKKWRPFQQVLQDYMSLPPEETRM
ncbi:uncharacterized protein LOC111609586 [Xiphophorus maculatus]|uniref:uncharacterized protein LOC111609586 n=1 Tax=Xiphophorus maculatus TaxID=8083 RepID=UPI000C6E6CE6|nr:uncharacterized protein LOC111609586 [Xiphophorus maculatus]